MDDLIDKQSVVDIVMCYCPDDDGSCSKADVDIRELLDEIENMSAVNRDNAPTIDAMPVQHGRWIPTEYDCYANGAPVWDKWECSECGHEHNGEKDTLTAFCPDCGAKMDAEYVDVITNEGEI